MVNFLSRRKVYTVTILTSMKFYKLGAFIVCSEDLLFLAWTVKDQQLIMLPTKKIYTRNVCKTLSPQHVLSHKGSIRGAVIK